jgi:hypothetical protein
VHVRDVCRRAPKPYLHGKGTAILNTPPQVHCHAHCNRVLGLAVYNHPISSALVESCALVVEWLVSWFVSGRVGVRTSEGPFSNNGFLSLIRIPGAPDRQPMSFGVFLNVPECSRVFSNAPECSRMFSTVLEHSRKPTLGEAAPRGGTPAPPPPTGLPPLATLSSDLGCNSAPPSPDSPSGQRSCRVFGPPAVVSDGLGRPDPLVHSSHGVSSLTPPEATPGLGSKLIAFGVSTTAGFKVSRTRPWLGEVCMVPVPSTKVPVAPMVPVPMKSDLICRNLVPVPK